MAKILEVSRVRHRVHFAPHPELSGYPTKPCFVETRLVRDISEFPAGVMYVYFDDVIETYVMLPGGERKLIYSPPVNQEDFFVRWTQADHQKILGNNWPGAVEVHPSLCDKVWVVASDRHQLQEHQAAKSAAFLFVTTGQHCRKHPSSGCSRWLLLIPAMQREKLRLQLASMDMVMFGHAT